MEAASEPWLRRLILDGLTVGLAQVILVPLTGMALPVINVWALLLYLILAPVLPWLVRRSLLVVLLSGFLALVGGGVVFVWYGMMVG